ncbi:MAG: thiol-activated cytolysin family protein [Bacteroidales bacterium]|nr:thiol-activated cytolysin family protein [Bacteroidales bacterium]
MKFSHFVLTLLVPAFLLSVGNGVRQEQFSWNGMPVLAQDEEVQADTVITDEAWMVTKTIATLGGSATAALLDEASAYGIILSEQKEPLLENGTAINASSNDNQNHFEVVAKRLEEGKVYYFRAYVSTPDSLYLGEVKKLRSKDLHVETGKPVFHHDVVELKGKLSGLSAEELENAKVFFVRRPSIEPRVGAYIDLNTFEVRSQNRLIVVSANLNEDGTFTAECSPTTLKHNFSYIACATVNGKSCFADGVSAKWNMWDANLDVKPVTTPTSAKITGLLTLNYIYEWNEQIDYSGGGVYFSAGKLTMDQLLKFGEKTTVKWKKKSSTEWSFEWAVNAILKNTDYSVVVFYVENGKEYYSEVMSFNPVDTYDKDRREAINEFLNYTVAKWEDKTSLIRNVNGQPAVPYVVEDGELYVLTKHEHNLNDGKGVSSEELFTSGDDPDMYPGALVWADQRLANGEIAPVAGLGIGKVDVVLDVDAGGEEYVKNAVNMTYGDIKAAVSELVRQFYKSHYRQPTRLTSATGDYSSTEEFAMKANLDVKFSAEFHASMNTTNKSISFTHVKDQSEIFYNVIVYPHDKDYSYLFGADVTVDKLKKFFAEHNNTPIAFISQVSYGRRLYIMDEYSARDFTLHASANGSYSGVSAKASTDITRTSRSRRQSVYLRGGDPAIGQGLIVDSANVVKVLKEYVGGEGALVVSEKNQALPMSYVTSFVGSGAKCVRRTTGSYVTYDYQRALHYVHVNYRNRCSHIGVSSSLKMRLDYRVFKVDSNGNKIYVSKQDGVTDGFYRWVEYKDCWGDNKGFYLKLKDDPEHPENNEYLEGPVRLQVRYKPDTQGWTNAFITNIYPDENGNIDIQINGKCGSRFTDSNTPYLHSSSGSKPVEGRL